MKQDASLRCGFDVKFVSETGRFEGYASVFDVTDSVQDRVAHGAFAATLEDYRKNGSAPPLLWQHDMAQPIGAWRVLREDSVGLYAEGELFINDIPRAREAYKLLKEKVVTGLSIGYRVRDGRREAQSGVRVLTNVELLEISLVTFPANAAARILRVKSGGQEITLPSERELEATLREAGLSRKQAKGILAHGYKALQREAVDALKDEAAFTEGVLWLANNIRAAITRK